MCAVYTNSIISDSDAGEDVFTWNKADIELFQKVHVIIAADGK